MACVVANGVPPAASMTNRDSNVCNPELAVELGELAGYQKTQFGLMTDSANA